MRRPPFPTRLPVPAVERPSLFIDALVEHVNAEGDVVIPEASNAAEPTARVDDGWDDSYGERVVEAAAPIATPCSEISDDELPALLFVETFGGKR